MRLGIMTGGGDAPGLNGVIESACRTLWQAGVETVGICDGFEGVFSGRTLPLTPQNTEGIHAQAGTLLGTSNRMGTKGREAAFLDGYKNLKLEGLIVCGGDGTFAGLQAFEKQIPLIGIPKTIDNDLSGTDVTFGYDTACTVVAEAVEALKATADAHRRVMVVETMGRTAGWIALGGGLAGYADAILIPEKPFSKTGLQKFLEQKKTEGRRGLLLAVAESAHPEGEDPRVAFTVPGAPQAERYGGIGEQLARWIELTLEWESRHVVLGHLQRSRFPTVTDRFLTLAMGVEVGRMALEGVWHQAVVYRGGRVQRASIGDLMGPPRQVAPDHRWVQLAQAMGIYI